MTGVRLALALAAALVLTTTRVHTEPPPTRTSAATAAGPGRLAHHPLPARTQLAGRARAHNGPRVMTAERIAGRRLTMYGTAAAPARVLIAGCASGTRCAGTDVVHAATVGCPPPDAELWLLPTLHPAGADLDATPDHPGAHAFRRAAADLRPTIAIVFRTDPRPRVSATGATTAPGRRFARLAHLPFTPGRRQGLAAWAATALPRSAGITVELPPGRVSARRATELAYAIDRLAGTRFADGARQDRLRMIAFGRDPRESRR